MTAAPFSLRAPSQEQLTALGGARPLGFEDPARLVRGVLIGDEAAAAALFDEYCPLVKRTVARILGTDAELPDVVQEAFMSALGSLSSLRDPQALTQWMRRVAVRTAVDWARRRKRRRWLSLVDPQELVHRPEVTASPGQRDALEATYEVLSSLPLPLRSAFALRYVEGLSVNELANACACSPATIKRRLAAAERRFRDLAKKEPTLCRFISEWEKGA